MEEEKEALTNIIQLVREAYRPTMTSLSQAMCGAFDIAGEHDKVVYRAIRELTERGIRERDGKRQNFPQSR